MITLEKCHIYLATHKAPVTVQQLADYFLISVTSVRHALLQLEKQNQAQSTIIGQRQYWSIKRDRRVAVPAEAHQVERSLVPNTSYPHVRGYDD